MFSIRARFSWSQTPQPAQAQTARCLPPSPVAAGALVLTLLFGLAPSRALAGGPGNATPSAPTVASTTLPVSAMSFWPKSVSPSADGEIYVQLPSPEAAPVATLECGKAIAELGESAWSHKLQLVHAFSLAGVELRTGTQCKMTVTGDSAVYESRGTLEIRGGKAPILVKSLAPVQTALGEENVVEMWGGYFSRVVTVTWVSTSDYKQHSRSTRVDRKEGGDQVVVPFAPDLSGLAPGEYLVVVENRDGSAAVFGGFAMVTRSPSPDIEEVRVVTDAENRASLLVSGANIESVREAVIRLPAGLLPLLVKQLEHTELPTLAVSLPPQEAEAFLVPPDVHVEQGVLVVTFLRRSSSAEGK